MTAETNNGNGRNKQRQWQKQTTATTKYRGLSAARRTVVPSAASVEMTLFFSAKMTFFVGVERMYLLIPEPCALIPALGGS
jgi:hypothetical protein